MMRTILLTLILSSAGANAALATGPVPADIRTFVKNADTCEHLAGEWDSNLEPARKREIEQGVDKYCFAAQRQLQRLEAKYRDKAMLRDMIAQHGYDSVRSYSKR
jgi:hypothetical protein